VREGLHNIFASFELLNQEGLMMCTNRLIESLKKYPEVNKSFDNNSKRNRFRCCACTAYPCKYFDPFSSERRQTGGISKYIVMVGYYYCLSICIRYLRFGKWSRTRKLLSTYLFNVFVLLSCSL